MALASGTIAALETSAQGQVLNRVTTAVLSLNLDEIKTRVYLLKQAFDHSLLELELPLAVVSIVAESATDAEGPVGVSTVHYPVLISLLWGNERSLQANWGPQLKARMEVEQAFRKTRPTWAVMSLCTLKKTTVKAGEPFIPEAYRKNLDAQWILIDVKVEETLQHNA